MTQQEREQELAKLSPQRVLTIQRVNLFYVFFALAMVVFFIIAIIANANTAIGVGDLVYGLMITARLIYWPESITLFGLKKSTYGFLAALFFVCGILLLI